MTLLIFVIIAAFAFIFALGAWLGAPYLPTKKPQITTALQLLNLKAGQTVIDLGSGDGSFLLAAAQLGIKGIGYEINPLLALISRLRTWRYRKLIDIHLANFWHEKLPEADAIFVFLIRRYMTKLDKKLQIELKKPTLVASYTFKIPGRQYIKSKSGVYLYEYNSIFDKR
jgi:ribosomal protein L11 methylase PrmA